jgi:cytochrome b subunit of formate dehydrogenase
MGGIFQYASDRDGYVYLARVSEPLIWTAIWLAIAFCAIHAIRRARRQPTAKAAVGYNLNQRLYHWGNFLLLGLVTFSGYWLFFQKAPASPLASRGIGWLEIHEWTGTLFAFGVLFHAVAATLRGDWRSMKPEWRDVQEAWLIWRNFLGKTSEYPVPRKYDPLQKIYHHILSLLAIVFTISGISMWFAVERWFLASRAWLQSMRILHDVSAVILVVLVVGHFYFSIIKVNRHNLKDMALGSAPQPAPGGDD